MGFIIEHGFFLQGNVNKKSLALFNFKAKLTFKDIN